MKTDASRRIVVWLVALVGLAAALTAALFAGAAGSAREAPTLIAFARPSGVYVMHADGSHARRLRRTVGLETMEVAWSPDGRNLAFTAYERATGRYAVWAMSADGRAAVRLGRFTRVAEPTWSADGASVAYAGVGRGIWIVKADGTELRQLETPSSCYPSTGVPTASDSPSRATVATRRTST